MSEEIKQLARWIWEENFMNCEAHCWCNCPEDLAVEMDLQWLKDTFRQTKHDHGPPGTSCTGCLLESGGISFVVGEA